MQNIIKIYKHITVYNILSMLLLVVIFVAIIFPIYMGVDSSLATTGTSVPSVTSLTLDSSSSSALVNLIVNDTNGTFAESTTNAQFSVTTNNYTGYTLSISDDGNTSLINNDASATTSNNTLSSITSISGISSNTFDNASYNGYWGYKPSKYNSVSNSNYLPSPSVVNSSTHSVVLDTTSSANNTANNYTIGLAMRADYTKPAGTYTKTLNLISVANPIIYSITYNKNTTDTVSNMPLNVVSQSTSSTSITLQNTTPSRSGYTFQGWCLGTVSADGTTCTGTTFQPNGSYGIDQTGDNRNVNLIAMWKSSAPGKCTSTATCMQTATACDTTLTDARDGNTYTVATINGNCWMTQNLRLAKNTPLDSSTSNIVNAYTTPSAEVAGQAASYTSGQETCSTNASYGCYYNYCAASAGTNCRNAVETNTYNICPKGWTLPTIAQQEGILSYSNIFSPIMPGAYYYGTLKGVEGQGIWWANSSYSTARVTYLEYQSNGSFYLRYNADYWYDAVSIRCIRQ